MINKTDWGIEFVKNLRTAASKLKSRLVNQILPEIRNTVENLKTDKRLHRYAVKGRRSILTVLIVLSLILFFLYIVPGIQDLVAGKRSVIKNDDAVKQEKLYKQQISSLTRDIQQLSRKYNSYTSGQSYIVINTTDNRFHLYRNRKLIREGSCSSGSYVMLKADGERKWIFKTPKGKYRIQGKIASPVWRKPDWAFVEEGLPVPSPTHPSRYERGVLGDYALSIGDGYLIHGTIYKRLLGMPVTHGCIRLNDEDLEVIYKTLSVGSNVYIF